MNRREFLNKSLAIGATVAIAPLVTAREETCVSGDTKIFLEVESKMTFVGMHRSADFVKFNLKGWEHKCLLTTTETKIQTPSGEIPASKINSGDSIRVEISQLSDSKEINNHISNIFSLIRNLK